MRVSRRRLYEAAAVLSPIFCLVPLYRQVEMINLQIEELKARASGGCPLGAL